MTSAIALILPPNESDLGDGFRVRRLLPQVARRAVGPFVFFDHMGPASFAEGHGLDVRPHPHIGLATVTYLFEGQIVHRDSLGIVQPIDPGAVNWMTAGRGIVHSERTAPSRRRSGERLDGIQVWVALPQAQAECEPSFVHHPAQTLPRFASGGAQLTLIAGESFGQRSPVAVASPLFYADARLAAAGELALAAEHEERACYVVDGSVQVDGETIAPHHVAVLVPGAPAVIRSAGPARVMLFGGAPLDGPRTIWWNFVASSKARIDQAKADWAAQRMGRVPGESEHIPLPG
ncbi:MAG: pirin family protein [Alphaproteobacteria bacterium]|nr:pirin family protein [Alphaproteobacteria bacterium]